MRCQTTCKFAAPCSTNCGILGNRSAVLPCGASIEWCRNDGCNWDIPHGASDGPLFVEHLSLNLTGQRISGSVRMDCPNARPQYNHTIDRCAAGRFDGKSPCC